MSEIVVQNQNQSVDMYSSSLAFEHAQRVAKMLCSSSMVPASYRGAENIGNALIAFEMSNRLGLSPMMVMQNLHIIGGRPSWSSQFLIAGLNSSGNFTPLRFKVEDLGLQKIDYNVWEGTAPNRKKVARSIEVRNLSCRAICTDKQTGETLEGPAVTIEMAVREGWYTKSDSKWPTMPELMLRYRAAAFFSRLYAPEMAMGFLTAEESADIHEVGHEVVSTRRTAKGAQSDAIDIINSSQPASIPPIQASPVTIAQAVDELNEGETPETSTFEGADDHSDDII